MQVSQFKKVYTDGACFPNPGKGGWGWTDLEGRERSGCDDPTTNQRMELMAVIDALDHHKDFSVEIVTDSQYVIKGATEWSRTWIRKGWKNAKGFPVKNKELWQKLLQRMEYIEVKFTWVKGHSGHPGNERADYLATMASGADPDTIERLKKAWH